MSADPGPAHCPDCGHAIVRRIAGPWCPACRGWLVRQQVSGYGDAAMFVWAISRPVQA